MIEVTFNVTGQDALLNNFSLLAKKIQKSLNQHAVRAAAEPMVDVARDMVPIGDGPGAGTLRKAIGLREYTNKGWSHAVVGVRVGRQFDVVLGTVEKGKNKGKVLIKRPKLYYKALEYGLRLNGVKVKAHPYMRPAWDAEGGNKALGRYIEDLKDGIAIAVSQLTK